MVPATPSGVATALIAGICYLAEVVYVSLPHATARLERAGGRTILYLDRDSPAEDLAWAMLDVMRVLMDGPDVATSARRVPRLSLVPPPPRTRPLPAEVSDGVG